MLQVNEDSNTMRPVERASELCAEIGARSDEIEALRRIPPELSASLARAGFFRMFVPEAVGGLETPPAEAVRVFETLATADASCAWVTFIGATSGSVLLRVPEATAKQITASPDTLITGVFAPSGTAERREGGFRCSGRWQFGSGCENANWILGGCQVLENGEPLKSQSGAPRTHMMLYPADDVEILDTWYVSGLKGTGSTDFRVDDLFVPEERAVGWLVTENPETPLGQFPQFTLLAIGIGAVCLGIARAALDEFESFATSKVRAGYRRALANRPEVQMKVARAEARVRSARSFYFETLLAAWDAATASGDVSLDARRDLRLATTNAVLQSVEAVDAMYTLGGGTSIYDTCRLQRQFRDIHVATQHIMVAESVYETVGGLYLGLEMNAQML